jgi:hypothetical protein
LALFLLKTERVFFPALQTALQKTFQKGCYAASKSDKIYTSCFSEIIRHLNSQQYVIGVKIGFGSDYAKEKHAANYNEHQKYNPYKVDMTEENEQSQRERLVTEALALFRSTHSKVSQDHPELFSVAKKLVSGKPMDDSVPEDAMQNQDVSHPAEDVQEKNMEIIMKFLTLKPRTQTMMRDIVDIMKSRHQSK